MGSFAGISRGVPVMYESKGRQYLVITAVQNPIIVGAPLPNAPATTLAEGTPIGAIAFALPRR